MAKTKHRLKHRQALKERKKERKNALAMSPEPNYQLSSSDDEGEDIGTPVEIGKNRFQVRYSPRLVEEQDV